MVTRNRTASSGSRVRRVGVGAKEFKKNFDTVVENVESVIKGKDDVVRLALVAILCEGHILFEDVPGTGKSMLARAIAQSMDATTSRIQCTPDMLPGDITGSSILDQKRGDFEFRPGPIFTNVLLADEVNRATPKTQSALLEAMAERRVSADGVTYELPRPFLVLATQNPVETAGTFPLPEAQLDRFLFKLSMGYMAREYEYEVMFDNAVQLSIEDLGAVIDTKDVTAMINYAATVDVAPEVGYYIVDLVQASRAEPAVAMGGSPRASIALLRAARVLAASDGRQHVYPDDVRAVLQAVMAHRVVLHPEAILRGDTTAAVMERITSAVKPPLSSRGRDVASAG
ncbi:MAG: MoxR family ATPase [Actinobacteria bacterium]|nr:MoxR family ATPase [Actinomycetota bacterium]MBV8961178.1 MoxR family ATPase [Actinomycetota bacterium]MBV9934944.1 MoxR family ATPase [Actinomycetota bacterium]